MDQQPPGADLEDVVDRIETKLERLEQARRELGHQIEVKRDQVHKLNDAIDSVRQLQGQLERE